MLTIDDSFRRSAGMFPGNVVLKYYQDQQWEQITYSEMNQAVNVTASGFLSLGVNRDSKIAIMSENRPEWMVCYLAIVTAGAVAVPIDAQLGEIETEQILLHSEVQVIICSMKCYDIITRILSNLPNLKTIIIFDRNVIVRVEHKGNGDGKYLADKGRKTNGYKAFLSYEELFEKGRNNLAGTNFPHKSINDIASIIYTSGTTGAAKGVILTHKNLMSNVDSTRCVITVNPDDTFVLLLPLHHAFPFTACMTLPLTFGACIGFVDIMSRDRTQLIMDCQPTIMVAVPLLYSKIFKGIIRQIEASRLKSLIFRYGGKKLIGKGLKKKLGGRLRLMVSGAAPMEPQVIEGFVSLGIEFLEGYGLTETSPVVAVNMPGKIKIGSVGPALTGITAKIANADPEGIGEIVVKGDNVMQGYYKNPEQTAKVIKDGWFYTGDLGTIDEDGYIFITGRAKDIIVTRGGKNVYPEIVESEINNSKYIAESVVIGYRTKGTVGEDVGVLISPEYETLYEYAQKQGMVFSEHIDLNDLTQDAKSEFIEKFRVLLESEVKNKMGKLAPYQRVTRIGIERDEFIKTSTRKIKRFLYKGRLDIHDLD